MNAIAERWVLSVKSECLDKMILVGEQSLRRALREYGAHFHGERPRQGIGNELVVRKQANNSPTGDIIETERLGGLLRSYQRAGAEWGRSRIAAAASSRWWWRCSGPPSPITARCAR